MESAQRNLDAVEKNISEKIETIHSISDYMIYSKDFRSFLTTPENEKSLHMLRDYQESIEGFATFQLMSKNYIKSITLEGFNGNRIDLGEPIVGSEQKWIERASEANGSVVWSDSYPIVSEWKGPKYVMSMYRVIYDLDKPTQPIGRVTIRLDESEMAGLLDNGIVGSGAQASIVRNDGTLMLGADRYAIGTRLADQELYGRLNTKEQSFRYTKDGEKMVGFIRPVEQSNWRIVASIEDSNIVQNMSKFRRSVEWMLILLCVFGLLGFIGFQATIIRPILELKRQTNRLQIGDFTAEVNIRTKDEIGLLGTQFNRMVHTIRDLIDHKYKLQIRQRESELQMLHSQMDPHFLYNTLDMIRWTARLESAMQTSGLIELLSRFFRLGITRDKPWTSLKEEMEYTQAYVLLLQERSGPRLRISLSMEHGLEDAVVLKHIVQPLVENSVRHGMEDGRDGTITVRGYTYDQELRIDVLDDGVGFSAERLQVLRSLLSRREEEKPGDEALSGHALFNIHERLSIVFGDGSGVELMETDGDGASIRLRMPLITSDKEAALKLQRTTKDNRYANE